MIITGKKFSKPAMSRVKNGDVSLPEKRIVKKARLDHLLVEKHPEYNRSTLQNFIKSGYVTLNGKIAKKPNAEIVTAIAENGQTTTRPIDIKLNVPKRKTLALPQKDIIYEDDNVLVVNKPAGLLSMKKGEYTKEPTLEDYGLLVHRLDRDTSGVVILAKNEAAQKLLRNQFQERKTHKTYFAIAEGQPKHDAALIDLPIARNLKHPTTFMVDPKGKPAKTYYKILKTIDVSKNTTSNLKNTISGSKLTPSILSLLELKPVTGRTHQLRVHLKYLGCPILGDPVYGTNKTPKTRLFLHAGSLEISIPGKDGEGNIRKTFTADLPSDFKTTMEQK